MKHRASLDEVIQKFAALPCVARCEIPELAETRCAIVSASFAWCARLAGHPAEVWKFASARTSGVDVHYVAVVGDTVIDFTASQYGLAGGFPIILPSQAYAALWETPWEHRFVALAADDPIPVAAVFPPEMTAA